jgi:hypothetical protein
MEDLAHYFVNGLQYIQKVLNADMNDNSERETDFRSRKKSSKPRKHRNDAKADVEDQKASETKEDRTRYTVRKSNPKTCSMLTEAQYSGQFVKYCIPLLMLRNLRISCLLKRPIVPLR